MLRITTVVLAGCRNDWKPPRNIMLRPPFSYCGIYLRFWSISSSQFKIYSCNKKQIYPTVCYCASQSFIPHSIWFRMFNNTYFQLTIFSHPEFDVAQSCPFPRLHHIFRLDYIRICDLAKWWWYSFGMMNKSNDFPMGQKLWTWAIFWMVT